MMEGLGVDVSLIERFKGKDELAKRVLSPGEYEEYLRSPSPETFLSSRFSVKESYVKASGDRKVDYRDLEVRHEEDGRPVLFLKGKKVDCLLSISHDFVSFAVVLLKKGGNLQ